MASFSNTATLSYSGGCVNSNTVFGTVKDELTAVKTAVNESYSVGDRMTYIISLVSAGGCGFKDISLTDDMGAFYSGSVRVTPLSYNEGTVKYYVNGTLMDPPAVLRGQNLMFTGISVPSMGNAIIIYEATVTQHALDSESGMITNTVTVCGDGISKRITASSTAEMSTSPLLTVSKSICPAEVSPKGNVTYTFTIQNSGAGEAAATDGVILRDTFEPRINITSVTFNGAQWYSPESYNYSAITGEFSTVSGKMTVPAATRHTDADGDVTVTPGVSTLVINGTLL